MGQKESTLHLVLRLRGGGKKRKKKNYTTPKKIKHKRKKVKLAILKYYKVDENGKITRLRRECPSESCGASVFMAQHFEAILWKMLLDICLQQTRRAGGKINDVDNLESSFVKLKKEKIDSL